MKGQIKLEFIFGVVFFSAIVVFAAAQISTALGTTASESRLDSLKANAISSMELLARDQGLPANWESNPGQAKRIGLSTGEPYVLSQPKIAALAASCSLLNSLGFGNYRLNIYNTTQAVLSCGTAGIPQQSVVVSRNVIISGQHGNMTLELW
jgi:hypothetical protein